jgi:hypothetical protein
LIAMRPPYFSEPEPDQLFIVGPTSATRVEVRHASDVLASAPLAGGVGRIQLPGPLDATMTVYHSSGKAMAERPFKDWSGPVAANRCEPPVRRW